MVALLNELTLLSQIDNKVVTLESLNISDGLVLL